MACNMTEPREPVGTATQMMPGELNEEQQLGIVLANPRIGHMQHPLVYKNNSSEIQGCRRAFSAKYDIVITISSQETPGIVSASGAAQPAVVT